MHLDSTVHTGSTDKMPAPLLMQMAVIWKRSAFESPHTSMSLEPHRLSSTTDAPSSVSHTHGDTPATLSHSQLAVFLKCLPAFVRASVLRRCLSGCIGLGYLCLLVWYVQYIRIKLGASSSTSPLMTLGTDASVRATQVRSNLKRKNVLPEACSRFHAGGGCCLLLLVRDTTSGPPSYYVVASILSSALRACAHMHVCMYV